MMTEKISTKKLELVGKLAEELCGAEGDLTDERLKVIRHSREELEDYLFNESYKINNSSKQFILKLFLRVEALVQEVNFENVKLKKEVVTLTKAKENLTSVVEERRMPLFSEMAKYGKSSISTSENNRNDNKINKIIRLL